MSRFPAERLDREAYPGPGVDLEVLYADLDTNAHLNNVALGRFFEHHRVLFNHAEALQGHFLVVRVAIDYVDEGRFGTPLHVRTRAARVGTTSLTVEQGAWQDERCIGLSEVVLAHVRDGRPAPLPPEVRARLAP